MPALGFDPQSGHTQESTNECINKWDNKISLSHQKIKSFLKRIKPNFKEIYFPVLCPPQEKGHRQSSVCISVQRSFPWQQRLVGDLSPGFRRCLSLIRSTFFNLHLLEALLPCHLPASPSSFPLLRLGPGLGSGWICGCIVIGSPIQIQWNNFDFFQRRAYSLQNEGKMLWRPKTPTTVLQTSSSQ